MTTTRQSKVPSLIADYFHITAPLSYGEHPSIAQTFRLGEGWANTSGRVSISALRKLRSAGVDSVLVDYQGRRAEFTIVEVLRYADRPLPGGRVA